MIRKSILYVVTLLLLVFTSCVGSDDYVNAIPQESTLIISINPAKVSGAGNATVLKALLHVSNFNNSGIDLSSNIYLFEDARGNFGVCAKIDNQDDFTRFLQKLGATGVEDRGDYQCAVLNTNSVIAYSDQAVLMMNNVLPVAQAETITLLSQYLKAEEKEGIKAAPMYAKLDSIKAPMAMVCQAQALPEQFVAPFTLGAPKNADPSQILIAAEMELNNNNLLIKGRTFSFKKAINDAIQKACKVYRPIEGRYARTMSQTDATGLFMNVDGTKFIELMRQNSGIRAMLSGINTAIDMDNIIKSIDGDMAIITPVLGDKGLQLMMSAKLKHADWLADVDYWKQSVPQGGMIGDWGKDCYYYKGDGTSYYFGVTDDGQYMSGGSEAAALQSVKASVNPINSDLQTKIKGEKMVMIINVAALQKGKAQAITSLFKPLFGDLQSIVYTLK